MYPGAPYGGTMVPAEANSVKSMLRIVRILALIFGIIFILITIPLLILAALAPIFFAPFGVVILIWAILDFVIFVQAGEIRDMVDQGRYQEAKSKTLIWMILGFILGGIIIGILFLVAYLKFDPLINWQRGMGTSGAGPGWGAPAASAPPPMAGPGQPPMTNPGQPPMAAAPAAAPAAPTPNCPRCGRPATWIAQYSRWYCYTDSQYL